MSPGFLFLHVSDRVTAGRNLCFLQSPVSVPFFSSSATRICSFVSSVSKRLLACLSFLGLDAQLLDLVASVRIPPLPSLPASFSEMPSQQATCSAPLVARSQTHAVRQYLVLYHASSAFDILTLLMILFIG